MCVMCGRGVRECSSVHRRGCTRTLALPCVGRPCGDGVRLLKVVDDLADEGKGHAGGVLLVRDHEARNLVLPVVDVAHVRFLLRSGGEGVCGCVRGREWSRARGVCVCVWCVCVCARAGVTAVP